MPHLVYSRVKDVKAYCPARGLCNTLLTGLLQVTLGLFLVCIGTLAALSLQGELTRLDSRILLGLSGVLSGVGLTLALLRQLLGVKKERPAGERRGNPRALIHAESGRAQLCKRSLHPSYTTGIEPIKDKLS